MRCYVYIHIIYIWYATYIHICDILCRYIFIYMICLYIYIYIYMICYVYVYIYTCVCADISG